MDDGRDPGPSTRRRAVAAGGIALLTALVVFSYTGPPAGAHWDGGTCNTGGATLWQHAHTRYHYFLNSVQDADWRQQAREAQLDWDRNTHIAMPSASTHAQAHVHAVDAAYGTTGWTGLAYYPCFHDPPGQDDDHVRMNLTYESTLRKGDGNGDGTADGVNALQAIVCQEIGHMAGGLNHYAGDCMGYSYYSCFPCSTIGAHTISDTNRYFTSPPDRTAPH